MDERDHPVFAWRMDEIRAALAEGLLQRLPKRISAHRRNYDYVAEKLEGLPGIWLRKPAAPGAYLGQSLNFRLEGASPQQCIWFAQALTAEGVDARAFADQIKPNARSFWNWRFLVGNDPEKAKARLPQAGRYIAETIDIPLSPNLTQEDADHVVAAVRKVLPARPGVASQAA